MYSHDTLIERIPVSYKNVLNVNESVGHPGNFDNQNVNTASKMVRLDDVDLHQTL